MLERLHQLAEDKENFAFETILTSKTLAHLLKVRKLEGYAFHLFYLWLPSPEFAVARVAERVRMGGHNVPEATVHRSYHCGQMNFFRQYRSIAGTWRMYDNSRFGEPHLISSGESDIFKHPKVVTLWESLKRDYHG